MGPSLSHSVAQKVISPLGPFGSFNFGNGPRLNHCPGLVGLRLQAKAIGFPLSGPLLELGLLN